MSPQRLFHLRFVRLGRILPVLPGCRVNGSGGKTNDSAQVLGNFPCFHPPAAFLRVIAGVLQQTHPRSHRCRTNSHSTRMMVGAYIFQPIDLADSRSVSSALDRREEYVSLIFPACD